MVEASGGCASSVAVSVILIVSYLTLNSTLNLLNRWALGIYGFSFPILLTICHTSFAFVALLPAMVWKFSRTGLTSHLKRQWLVLCGIGCLTAMNVGLNNLSLVKISLSLNQVIRYVLTHLLTV